jgi:predicted nucleic-acid-binding Zn-ribbon protein
MARPIQIRELTEPETVALTQSAKFNTLYPSRCLQCGNTQAFTRKVFWIGGVPKAEQDSDQTQGLLAHHLRQRHNIASVFFKTYRNRFYVDSARCEPCGSTNIEFDLELSDDLLAVAAKLSGKPVEELRREIEAGAARIAQHDRAAQPEQPRGKESDTRR